MSSVDRKKDIKGKDIKLNDIVIYGGINGSSNKIGVALIGIVIDLLPESDPRVKILVSNTRKPKYKFITRYKCADRLCILDTEELDNIRNICNTKKTKIFKKARKDTLKLQTSIGDGFFNVVKLLDTSTKDSIFKNNEDPLLDTPPHILQVDETDMLELVKDIIKAELKKNKKVDILAVRDVLRSIGYYALYKDTKVLYNKVLRANINSSDGNNKNPFSFS